MRAGRITLTVFGLKALAACRQLQSGHSDRFHCGYMYWAPARPLLCHDWRAVVVGTIAEIIEDADASGTLRLTGGRLAIDEVLLDRPVPQEAFGVRTTMSLMGGLDGLAAGDRVIVFITEYDGGYAVQEAAGSNCKVGIRLTHAADPILGIVRRTIAVGSRDALKDRRVAAVWREYESIGVDAVLRDVSHLQIVAERADDNAP
jgi:hypothetical protein